jgi:hypothetical protein
MCAESTPNQDIGISSYGMLYGYMLKGSYEGIYCPCSGWDMIALMTTPEEYISPVYYYSPRMRKDNWGKKLRDKIQFKKITPPPNCQPLQCNPLRLITNYPHSLIMELSVLRHCGLGTSLIGSTDPIGLFLLELLKKPATTVLPPVPCPPALS